jgi:hypothetical protein
MRENHGKIKFFFYMGRFEFKTLHFSALSYVKIHWFYDGNEYKTTIFCSDHGDERFLHWIWLD